MTSAMPAGIDDGRFAALDSVSDVAVDEIAPANVVDTLLANVKMVMVK